MLGRKSFGYMIMPGLTRLIPYQIMVRVDVLEKSTIGHILALYPRRQAPSMSHKLPALQVLQLPSTPTTPNSTQHLILLLLHLQRQKQYMIYMYTMYTQTSKYTFVFEVTGIPMVLPPCQHLTYLGLTPIQKKKAQQGLSDGTFHACKFWVAVLVQEYYKLSQFGGSNFGNPVTSSEKASTAPSSTTLHTSTGDTTVSSIGVTKLAKQKPTSWTTTVYKMGDMVSSG